MTISALLFLIAVRSTIWIFNQEVTGGYIFASRESDVRVIELALEEADGKSQEEILKLLNEKVDESE